MRPITSLPHKYGLDYIAFLGDDIPRHLTILTRICFNLEEKCMFTTETFKVYDIRK